MDNFSYYPKGIIMKDGKISEENTSQPTSDTNTANSSSNFGNLFSNKNINDILPLLLGKANLNKNEMLSQIMNNISKEDKGERKVTFKKQNFLDEM